MWMKLVDKCIFTIILLVSQKVFVSKIWFSVCDRCYIICAHLSLSFVWTICAQQSTYLFTLSWYFCISCDDIDDDEIHRTDLQLLAPAHSGGWLLQYINEIFYSFISKQSHVFSETLDKEMCKLEKSAVELSFSQNSTNTQLHPRRVIQAVKAICALLGNLEPLEMTFALDQFVNTCSQYSSSSQVFDIFCCKGFSSSMDCSVLYNSLYPEQRNVPCVSADYWKWATKLNWLHVVLIGLAESDFWTS